MARAVRGSGPGKVTMGHNGALARDADPMSICRNVTVAGRRTSVRMEVVFWDGLMEICAREQIGLNEICTRIDAARKGSGLTGALRVFVLCYFRELTRRPAPVQPPVHASVQTPPALLAAALEGVIGARA